MLVALFVLSSQAPDRTLFFDVAAFGMLASIAAYGRPTRSELAGSSGG